MNRLNPEKLTVEFMEGVTKSGPLFPRRYALTHSDGTGDLYLQLGKEFAYDRITSMRDDVLGEWILGDGFQYLVYLHMNENASEDNGDSWDSDKVSKREEVFRRELPLALQAIRYGDREFFNQYPDLNLSPIIVYYLYDNPELNKAENWGTFADYSNIPLNGNGQNKVSLSNPIVNPNAIDENNQQFEHDLLIDEVMGDINGDGVVEKIGIYGDKIGGSELIRNIVIKVESIIDDKKPEWFGWSSITEVNAYNPTLFLGDFTGDQVLDILFTRDMSFSAMYSFDKGRYGAEVMSFSEGTLDTIFTSGRYYLEYPYVAEFADFYKISVWSVRMNRLLFLDISYMGKSYLSRYYNEDGRLIKPMQSKVQEANPILPIVSNLETKTFDLLALHPITGGDNDDFFGYLSNLLQWNGEEFVIVTMMVSAPGTYLIPPMF